MVSAVSLLAFNAVVAMFFLYGLFVADPDSDGLGGMISRGLTERVPAAYWWCMQKLMGKKRMEDMREATNNAYSWLCDSPNPVMQIVYMVLVNGSFLLFLLEGYPEIPNLYLDEYHKQTAFLVMAACIATFAIACLKGPGVITQETARSLANYPFDNLLYTKRNCKTCKTVKLARSKHCRVCNHCVSRFDHHCGWLNQCVGEDNYRHFLFFLLVHCLMLAYGSVLIGSILASDAQEKRLWDATFINTTTNQRTKASPLIIAQYFMFHRGRLLGLLALASCMGLVLAGFFLYHIWLIVRGQTTNEAAKWKEVAGFHRRLTKAYKDSGGRFEGMGEVTGQTEGKQGKDGGGDSTDKPAEEEEAGRNGAGATGRRVGLRKRAGKRKTKATEEGDEVKQAEEEDKEEDKGEEEQQEEEEEEAEEKAPAPDGPSPPPGKRPLNIYNQGILANLYEVLRPRCNRPQGSRWRKAPPGDPYVRSHAPYWLED